MNRNFRKLAPIITRSGKCKICREGDRLEFMWTADVTFSTSNQI